MAELMTVLPSSSVHSSRLPCLRTAVAVEQLVCGVSKHHHQRQTSASTANLLGMIFLAYSLSSGSPACSKICKAKYAAVKKDPLF